MLSGQAENALRLMPFTNLFNLVNRRQHTTPLEWEHLSDGSLANLDAFIANPEVFNHVAYNSVHPTLDELIVIINNDLMRSNFNKNIAAMRHLNKKNISRAQYFQLLGYQQQDFTKFLINFSKTGITFLHDQNLLTLDEIRTLNENQINILTNDVIQYLLMPGLMPLEYTSLGDDLETPILSVQRALNLTPLEKNILTSPAYQEILCKRVCNVDELIAKHQELNNSEQVLIYFVEKAAKQALYQQFFPGCGPEILKTLYKFDSEFINEFFSCNDKTQNVARLEVLSALSPEDQTKLNNFKPRNFINLYFKHNAMSLERILRLTADEIDFIRHACGHDALRNEIINGKFEELYARSKRAAAPTERNGSDLNAQASFPAPAPAAPVRSPLDTARDSLITDLTNYCNRVTQTQMSCFRIFGKRRNLNRIANHDLAVNVITSLQQATSINEIRSLFSRANIKDKRQKKTCFNTINSRELNQIIRRGRRA